MTNQFSGCENIPQKKQTRNERVHSRITVTFGLSDTLSTHTVTWRWCNICYSLCTFPSHNALVTAIAGHNGHLPWFTFCTAPAIHYILRKKTEMFFVMSSTKLGRFWWNLVDSFRNKFAANHRNVSHLTWIVSLHYLVKLTKLIARATMAHSILSRCFISFLSVMRVFPDTL